MMDTASRNALILELRRNGATSQQIADRLGITRQRVDRIANRKPARERRGRPCPECGGPSRLLWVKDQDDGSTKRRRECLSCKLRWNRIEADEKSSQLPASE